MVNHADRGSNLIKVTDLESASVSPANLPAIATHGPLTGGDDGLTGLADADFVGNAAGKTGLHALDLVQDLSLLIVPGRATAAVHDAMVSYCEVNRDKGCFAVLDPPANSERDRHHHLRRHHRRRSAVSPSSPPSTGRG